MSNDSSRIRMFQERMPRYRNDPILFAEEVVHFTPDDWQQKALIDVKESPKVAIKSGQGVGKTGIEAIALLWFLCCFPYPRVVATAPTKQQLNDILWSEVSKWQSRSPLLSEILKWTKTYIYMKGNEKRWFAVARTATKPENMQGFHEDNMLFIVDEASGVADPIMEAILGTLSGANNKLLMCGNPTKTSGTFYDAFTADRGLYRIHTVSSLDSKRTNKDNINSLIRKYGEESNVVRVRVKGLFPQQEDDVFIPISWIEQSIATDVSDDTLKGMGLYVDHSGNKVHEPDKIWLAHIGCDVARFGDDSTVISFRINERVMIYKKYHGQDTTWTASNIIRLFNTIKTTYGYKGKIAVKIDDGGVGGGVTDQLRAQKRSYPEEYKDMIVLPIQFGKPMQKHRFYYDSTTYMMGVIKDMIAPYDDAGNEQKCQLVLPDDNDLVGQLSCRKYSFVSNAKQKVESKKDMKDRGLRSPDEADSILLACCPVRLKDENNNDDGRRKR